MIRLSKSCISELEKKKVIEVLNNEYLGMGNYVKEFEEKIKTFIGREAVCVNSGTAALQLALEACDIGYGDEVLVPSLTYVASYQAITATGAKPIPCDIDLNSYIIDIEDANLRLTKYTKAIMPVFYTGGVGNLESIYLFAKKNKLRVIEDAAHAFGSIYKNKKIGSFGDITCFSFDGIKNITSGEGGCVITNDKKVLKIIKDKRLLGVEKDTEKRFSGKRSWDFEVKNQGWRYHMSNIMAGIGIIQLDRFSYFTKRRTLAKRYNLILSKNSKIKLIDRDYDNIVPHIYVIRIPDLKNREVLQELMIDKGIQTGVHYKPNHHLSFFKDNIKHKLKVTDKVYREILTLPLHPDLSIENVNFICESLNHILNSNKIDFIK